MKLKYLIAFALLASIVTAQTKLVSYEYWFNNDYAHVNQHEIDSVSRHLLNTDIDVSSLPNNVNVFNIRYKDSNGKYSSTLSKLFVKLPEAATANASKLVSYEYWFNNDYENVQKNAITAAQQDFLQTDIDVSSLPNNVNVFNIRYKDENGLYSSTLSKLFVKLPATEVLDNKLTEYTYWFDDDLENAKTVKLAEEVKVYEWIETIDLPENMAGRDHAINIRYKDQQNVWSVPFEKTFYNKFSPRIEFEGYVDEICFGELIQITPISVDVDSIYWDFGDGSPVLLRNGSRKVSHLYEAAGEYEMKVTYKHIASGDEFDTEDIIDSVVLPIIIHPAYGSKEVREYVFFEDFESNETGKLPDGWHLVYNGTGDANQKVVESPVMNGSKSLQLEGRSSWSAHLSKTIEEFPEQFTVEAWMQTNSLAAGGIGAGAGSIIISNMSVGSWGSDIARVSFNGGNIIYFNRQGTSYSPHFILGSYDTNEWYHIQMEVDLAAKTTQIYINNQLVEVEDSEGNLINEFPIHPTVEPAEITVSAGNGGTSKMFFDDVSVYVSNVYTNFLPTVDIVVCESDLPYSFGAQSLTENGVYTELFQTVNGCDSLATINFTVLETAYYTDVQVACGSFTWIDGNTYTESNNTANYTLVGQAANGCDSIVTLDLTINPIPDNSVTQNGVILTANQVGATYQWLDCNDDFQAIANENGQIFSPTKDGNYAVEISMNGCTVTSSCYEMNLTAIDHLYNNGIHIYPNPTHGIIYIDFGKEVANCAYAISDVSGQILNISEHRNTSVVKVDLSGFAAGVYFVAITEGGKTTVVKVVYTKIF